MIFTNVSGTIHDDSLALFELNIEIMFDNVTKPEMSNIPTLTPHVTSSVTYRSKFTPFFESSRTVLSNDVVIVELGPVV